MAKSTMHRIVMHLVSNVHSATLEVKLEGTICKKVKPVTQIRIRLSERRAKRPKLIVACGARNTGFLQDLTFIEGKWAFDILLLFQ